MYPRVLECILQTESPELMLSHKDEILETLDMVASDTGKSINHLPPFNDLTAQTTELMTSMDRAPQLLNKTKAFLVV